MGFCFLTKSPQRKDLAVVTHWLISYSSEQKPKYVVVVLLRGGKRMFGPYAAEIAGHLYRDLRQMEPSPTQASRTNAVPASKPRPGC